MCDPRKRYAVRRSGGDFYAGTIPGELGPVPFWSHMATRLSHREAVAVRNAEPGSTIEGGSR